MRWTSQGYQQIAKLEQRGSRIRGPPGCIKRLAAMFVNYVYTTKMTQYVRRLSFLLIVILLVRPANRPTTTGVAPSYKNLDLPYYTASLLSLADIFCHFPVIFRMRGSAADPLPSIHTTPRLQGNQKLWVTHNKNQSTFVQPGTTQALHVVTAPTNAHWLLL